MKGFCRSLTSERGHEKGRKKDDWAERETANRREVATSRSSNADSIVLQPLNGRVARAAALGEEESTRLWGGRREGTGGARLLGKPLLMEGQVADRSEKIT